VIALDTHAWLWWCDDPARLSSQARDAVSHSSQLAVSAVSLFELATLAARGRIDLDPDPDTWIADALAAARLSSDAFPGDPADRMIYATAALTGSALVTKDRALRAFDPRPTVW
jgi:PIN domain nuclease of toxin-antitoxin system